MSDQRDGWSRRKFVGGFTLVGAAGLFGNAVRVAAGEPLLETTRIRLGRYSALCTGPQFVAEQLLRAEASPTRSMSPAQASVGPSRRSRPERSISA